MTPDKSYQNQLIPIKFLIKNKNSIYPFYHNANNLNHNFQMLKESWIIK